MKIFLDTNVILEHFIEREDAKTATLLFIKLQEQKHDLYMSAGSVYTMIFLIDKYLRKELGMMGDTRVEALRTLMKGILKTITVVGHDKESLLKAVEDVKYKDIEDSCQYQAAASARCDYLLTYNVKDYPEATLPVLSPVEFLAQFGK